MGKQRTSTCPGKDKLYDELGEMLNVENPKIDGAETLSKELQAFATKMGDLCRGCLIRDCSRREGPYPEQDKTEAVPDASKK